ncbi:hypothetical protein [Roseobacter sp. CCS2]|uniref:hypothetical protein n=1 Tax=Roseobacter sp. CCS2 TaxID=391593 RepID=UPI0000F3DFEC|nr:hypothetical protein [Roseobacter sp. CCS2]EBA12084.1 hypothetical protein RCCS2_12344 [Roseobacter sp. CCS2]
MIRAMIDDRPAIEAFLKTHIATSLFPLSNLRRYGMAGGHPRAILFAASSQVCRAYDAIGFQRRGRYTIPFYKEPQVTYE